MTRAAELLHVTQPTLSRQLKVPEDELGKKLFTRHSFSIQLTEEGILLRKRAEDLVKMADKISTEFLAPDDTLGALYPLSSSKSSRTTAKTMLYWICFEVINRNPEVNRHSEMNHYILIWSVCTFVETRVQEEINLEELALQTGFSLAHVRDIFRQNTGKSLSHYIQERKIANAAQELLYTDQKIIDIAMRYGFSGRTVFSRVFRRHTGYTPSQFRLEQPLLTRIRLCAGVFGVGLPGITEASAHCHKQGKTDAAECTVNCAPK